MGWIGTSREVSHALRTFGAEQDEDGKFLIVGQPPASFLGLGDEILLDDKCCCLINGKPASVAALMGKTSYGCQVVVL